VALGGGVVHEACQLLTMDHFYTKLQRTWGPGDGRSVDELKAAIDDLVVEYLDSHNLDEAVRLVKALNAPYFHHEVIKRAVARALDRPDADVALIRLFLLRLFEEQVTTMTQFELGFDKLKAALSDLRLDVPCAGRVVQSFIDFGKQHNFLTRNYFDVPVSEQRSPRSTRSPKSSSGGGGGGSHSPKGAKGVAAPPLPPSSSSPSSSSGAVTGTATGTGTAVVTPTTTAPLAPEPTTTAAKASPQRSPKSTAAHK